MPEVGKSRQPRLPMGPPIPKAPIAATETTTGSTTEILEDEDKILEPEGIEHKENKDGSRDGKENFEDIKRIKIPNPPTTHFKPKDSEEFFKWQDTLKPEHWLQMIWYFYRTSPKIIRPKDQFYIDCGGYPISEDWIVKNHGSGEYYIIVNDVGRPKNARKITQANFKIDNLDYPPNVKMDELDVYYDGNRSFVDRCIAQGKLTTDRKPMNSPNQSLGGDAVVGLLGKMIDRLDRSQVANTKDPKDAAITTAFEIIGKGNEAATKMMLDQMKEQDPDKLIKLVTLIMGMLPKPAEHKDESSSFLKILTDNQNKTMEILAKKDETILGLMTKMIENKATTQSGDDSFDKTIDRFLKFQELTGLVGGGSGKKSTLETVMQYGGPVLEKVFGMVQNLLVVKAQSDFAKANQGKTPPTTNLVVSAASPQVNQGGEDGDEELKTVESGNSGKDVRGAMQQSSEQQLAMIKEGLKQIGPKILEALARGTSGDSFAESIDTFMGPMVYNQLAALGESQILEILKSDNVLWSKLVTVEPALKKFVREFLSYGDDTVEPPPSATTTGDSKGGIIEDVIE